MKVRGPLPGEQEHLVRLWLDSFWWSKYALKWRRPGGKVEYRTAHGKRLNRLFERSTVRVLSDDEGSILGFSVVEPGIVHYAMAKHSFHSQGVAEEVLTMLLREELQRPCLYTHELCEFRGAAGFTKRKDGSLSSSGFKTNLPIPTNWSYDPYAILDEAA